MFQKDFSVLELQVAFSFSALIFLVERLSTSTGVNGNLEKKKYAAAESVFTFISALLDRVTKISLYFVFRHRE